MAEERKPDAEAPATPAPAEVEEQRGGQEGTDVSPEVVDELFEDNGQEEAQPGEDPEGDAEEVTLRKRRTWGDEGKGEQPQAS